MDASQPPLIGTVVPHGTHALQSVPGDDAFHDAPPPATATAAAKPTGRRRVHFAPTNEFVEPEGPSMFALPAAPSAHSAEVVALDQREPMLAAVSPQEVVVEYNRAAVWRLGVVVTLLALPLLYFTPIVGLLLVFPCAHCVYWVNDRVRFHGGGDPRSCSNRDCALITGVLGIFSAFVIDVINVLCLVIYLNETPTLPSGGSGDSTIATEGTGAPAAVTAITSTERDLRRVELAWGVLLLPLLALLLRHVHRLRHVLSAVDARSQDLVEDYV